MANVQIPDDVYDVAVAEAAFAGTTVTNWLIGAVMRRAEHPVDLPVDDCGFPFVPFPADGDRQLDQAVA